VEGKKIGEIGDCPRIQKSLPIQKLQLYETNNRIKIFPWNDFANISPTATLYHMAYCLADQC